MNKIKSIAVFCASSRGNDQVIIEQAQELGKTLANQKITLVYGGAKVGIMGEVAQFAIENNGKVIGVIPEFLKIKEVVHNELDELITTQNMHERKLKIHELSDAFVALPGGFGTFEELFEITTLAQLGLHKKPIGVLNSNGFYNDLINMFKTMVAKGLLKKENMEILVIEDNIHTLLEKLQNFKPRVIPKWLKVETT